MNSYYWISLSKEFEYEQTLFSVGYPERASGLFHNSYLCLNNQYKTKLCKISGSFQLCLAENV